MDITVSPNSERTLLFELSGHPLIWDDFAGDLEHLRIWNVYSEIFP